MSTEVKVPVLPESVADATVAAWHKKPGDTVRRDENLVDLETDKVVLEVPAPVDGVLKEIVSDSGATVTSDEVLGVIEAGEVAPADASGKAPAQETKADSGDDEGPTEAVSTEGEKLSPATRRIVEEENVDPKAVEGTGRGGRLTKGDVVNYLAGGGARGPVAGARTEERVKMTRLRSTIARRLKDAQNTAAILTSFQEVDLHAVQQLRAKYKETFLDTHGVKLGLMSFFVKACCHALSKYPVVNASLDGDEIVYHGYMDIGIAVSTERGLMVPVLRNAESMTLAEIEAGIRQYAVQAREGTMSLEDLQGGTFSITNGGTFGSMLSTPLLNPPQSAILGMHNIKERPVVVEGEIVVRPIMYLALSYDHRIIDGKDSVQFLMAVKEALEDPARLLLNL